MRKDHIRRLDALETTMKPGPRMITIHRVYMDENDRPTSKRETITYEEYKRRFPDQEPGEPGGIRVWVNWGQRESDD